MSPEWQHSGSRGLAQPRCCSRSHLCPVYHRGGGREKPRQGFTVCVRVTVCSEAHAFNRVKKAWEGKKLGPVPPISAGTPRTAARAAGAGPQPTAAEAAAAPKGNDATRQAHATTSSSSRVDNNHDRAQSVKRLAWCVPSPSHDLSVPRCCPPPPRAQRWRGLISG
jgi:hypothetical protein